MCFLKFQRYVSKGTYELILSYALEKSSTP
jgi:hypothetical protein